MQTETLRQELAELSPTEVRMYAIWEGWKPVATKNQDVILLAHPTRKLQQIILPTYAAKNENLPMFEEAVRTLADEVGRPVREIVSELLQPPADVIQLRLRSDATALGTVPLETGLELIRNGRDLLLAAASSAFSAQGHHARMSYKPAVEFLKTCRMGQTEKGSFVATIHAPVPSTQGMLFVDPEEDIATAPFARKATMTLMKGAASIRQFLDRSSPDLISEDVEHGVSANLCDAITALKIDDPHRSWKLECDGLGCVRTCPLRFRRTSPSSVKNSSTSKRRASGYERKRSGVRNALKARSPRSVFHELQREPGAEEIVAGLTTREVGVQGDCKAEH